MSSILTSARSKRLIIPVACVVAAAIAISAFLYLHASTTTVGSTSAADDASGVGVLLGLADGAYREHRLIAPAGSNMFEFYLSVLQLDPHNAQAINRLNAAFEPASGEVEHTIAKGDLDEAERELRLLHDYGDQQVGANGGINSSYKVDLLGSYLYAQRNLLARQHEAEAARMHDAQAAATTN